MNSMAERLRRLEVATRKEPKSWESITGYDDSEETRRFLAGERRQLSQEEENFLYGVLQKGTEEQKRLAAIILQEANLRLVAKIVWGYHRDHLEIPIGDMLTNGFLGLNIAVRRFNPSKGRFSSIATPRIRQKLAIAINQDRAIHLPQHVCEWQAKVRKVGLQWEKVHQQEPTVAELAVILKMSEVDLMDHLAWAHQPSSLEELFPVGDENRCWEEVIPDPQSGNVERGVGNVSLGWTLKELLAQLTERERFIISLHYGLEDGVAHTLEEIGRLLGVSRERVRQIENRALKKLKKVAPPELADF